MKYAIELTNKQKAQMDCMMEIVHRYVGFNPKLEPIESSWESELEKHREQAYNKGFEDGNKIADKDLKEIQESTYDVAYNKGVEDFEELFMYEDDYKQFFEDTYGSKNPAYNLFDLVAKYGAKKVVNDFNKWQEEKKKAEEEIKIGDIVITDEGIKAIVLDIDDYDSENIQADVFNENGCYEIKRIIDLKYIGATNWVLQLLDKLRGLKE